MISRDKVELSLEMDLNRGYVCKECGVGCSGAFDVEVLFSRNGKKCGLNIWSLFSCNRGYDNVKDVMKYLEDKYGLIGGCWEKFNEVGDGRCVIMYEGLKESDLNRVYVISKLGGSG